MSIIEPSRQELKMINRPDEVVATWTGQDGSQWRDLRCWVGNGYRTFTQRLIDGGIWV